MKKTFAAVCAAGLFALSAQTLAQTETPRSDQNSFTGWMGGYATKNNGRISRQAYMDEAGRRWDAMDKTRQGLTMDEINRTYGYSPTPVGVQSAPGRPGNAPKGN